METLTQDSQDDEQLNINVKTCQSTWRILPSQDKTPSQRSLHVGVIFEDSLYVFGGYDGTQRTNDFYCYDFETSHWSQIESTNSPPTPRDRHVGIVHDKNIYIFGGFDGVNRVNDFYFYNKATNSWKEVPNKGTTPPPSPRHSHAGCTFQKHLYIFAGYDGFYRNDLYKFSFETFTWFSIKDSNPSAENWPKPRYRTSLSAHKEKIYMFGGHDGIKQLNDFYSFDPKLQTWSQINTPDYSPSPRDSHVSIICGNSLYLFGGSTGIAISNSKHDFYEFSIEEKKWYQIACDANTTPSSRFCHIGVLYNKKFIVFGGYDGVNRLNDFYEHACEPEISYPESTILNDLANLVNNPVFSDIQFVLEGDRVVYAHKIMLIRVPYFSAMFQAEMKECRENSIGVKGISLETFLKMMKYIYTDRVDAVGNMEKIVELFEAADLYGIEGLKLICEKEIFTLIDTENASGILVSADRRAAFQLREHAVNFIIKNFDVVSKTKGFEEMMRSDVELALEILKKR